MSRPIAPHEEESLYLPTQHLCDSIRRAGYDGVIYPSAMGPGSNFVFFDAQVGSPLSVGYNRVDAVNYEIDEIPEDFPLFEEGTFDHLVRR